MSTRRLARTSDGQRNTTWGVVQMPVLFMSALYRGDLLFSLLHLMFLFASVTS